MCIRDRGYEVSGSDRTRSHKTEALEAHGVKVLIGHKPENVRGAQLVIYSAAIAVSYTHLDVYKRQGYCIPPYRQSAL